MSQTRHNKNRQTRPMDPTRDGRTHHNHNLSSSEHETVNIVCTDPTKTPPHSVQLPPHEATWTKLRLKLAEVFFPDDPLHAFKNQTWFRKTLLALQYVFPIFQWAPHYNLKLFRDDIVAGLTIASLSIPQGISYAKLANLPPINGLYSSFVPPLVYAVLGSSKHLGVGPTSITSLVIATMLGEVADPETEQDLYLRLAYTTTLFSGIFQTSLSLFRLGFIVDFLSKATLIGFMAGVAVVVILQQCRGLFNITHFTTKMQIIPVIEAIFSHTNEWSWKNVLLAITFLMFLLITRQISARRPKLFWVSAVGPLMSVILSTLTVFILRNQLKGDVSIIGDLPEGVNPLSTNMLIFSGSYLPIAIKTGIITGILALTEGIAVGRAFASLENYQIDGNKEMLALGLMNITGCCTSCYVTSGAFSRSAVNYNAGAKTAMSNIIMALTVLVALLFLIPLFHYTPNLVLSAIIITAVVGLIDYQAAWRLWKLDKLDFICCASSFFGVLFISVQIGLAIAVTISLFKIVIHVMRPNTVVLGNFRGTPLYCSLSRYDNTARVPGFLILAIESSMLFANATYLQERILRWVRDEDDRIEETGEDPLKCVVIDMTAVANIDTSGIDTIAELLKLMTRRSIQVALINPVANVMEKIHRSKILESYDKRVFYLTTSDAISDISSSWKASA